MAIMNSSDAAKYTSMNFKSFDTDNNGWVSMEELRKKADQPGSTFSGKKDSLAAQALLNDSDILYEADKTDVFQSRDGEFTQASLKKAGDRNAGVDFSNNTSLNPNDFGGVGQSKRSQHGGNGSGAENSDNPMNNMMDMIKDMMKSLMDMMSSLFNKPA